ncbi:MAG: hypothetical protein Q9M10_05845 [Mariprofundaceae bacterium]|nr:hypothetical protein [Mariprofundaceae bacterium]
MKERLKVVNKSKMWINPDCGLKTRKWEEVEPALKNMVQATLEIRKDGYLDKQNLEVKRFRDMEQRRIPDDLDYTMVKGLSMEGQQKLAAAKPSNLGQASRISGVTPAAMTSLMIYLQQMKET